MCVFPDGFRNWCDSYRGTEKCQNESKNNLQRKFPTLPPETRHFFICESMIKYYMLGTDHQYLIIIMVCYFDTIETILDPSRKTTDRRAARF